MEPEFVLESLNNIGPAVVVFIVLAILLVSVLGTVLLVWAYCRIFSKAGFSWAMGLLMLVPLVNAFIPFILAFSDWPVQRELKTLKEQSR
jgi:hypothetical protein